MQLVQLEQQCAKARALGYEGDQEIKFKAVGAIPADALVVVNPNVDFDLGEELITPAGEVTHVRPKAITFLQG